MRYRAALVWLFVVACVGGCVTEGQRGAMPDHTASPDQDRPLPPDERERGVGRLAPSLAVDSQLDVTLLQPTPRSTESELTREPEEELLIPIPIDKAPDPAFTAVEPMKSPPVPTPSHDGEQRVR